MPRRANQPRQSGNGEYVQRLRHETAAVRLMHGKFGVRRALSKAQVQDAAETFDADGTYLSATKKLINTKHVAFKACTKIISQARGHWRTMTVPFPVDGIRLIRKDLVESFDQKLTQFRDELEDAAEQLQDVYADLREEARTRLGELFNPADYPSDIGDAFRLDWDYPNVEPPDHLRTLNPRLFEQEQQRAAQRFEEAIRLAEDAFAGELQKLVGHLVECLSGSEDGKPKVFRDSTVSNITEFFTRFKSLRIGDNAELDQLVERAEQIVGGIDVADLRKDGGLRASIATQMQTVQQALDGLVVERPIRAIELPEE